MKNSMKNKKMVFSVLSIILVLMFVMVGCTPTETPAEEVPAVPENNTSIVEVSVEKTLSDVRVVSVPADVEIPSIYSEVKINGVDGPVYAFTDEAGMTQLRVYGERDALENGVVTETKTGFFAAGVKTTGEDVTEDTVYLTAIALKEAADTMEAFVDETAEDETDEDEAVDEAVEEDVVAEEAVEITAPTYELVFAEDADVIKTATDVAGQCVVEVPGEDAVIPEGYVAVEGKDGLFSYVNIMGETVYRVYGAFEGQDAAFWMANEFGNMVKGAFMVDTDMEHALMHAYNDAVAFNANLAEGDEAMELPANETYVVLNMDAETVQAMLATPEKGTVVEAAPEEQATESAAPTSDDKAEGTTGGSTGGSSGGNNGGSGSGNSGGNSGGSGNSGGNSGGGSNNGGGGSVPQPEQPVATPAPEAPKAEPTPVATPKPAEPTPAPEVPKTPVYICKGCNFTTESSDEIIAHCAFEGSSYKTGTR